MSGRPDRGRAEVYSCEITAFDGTDLEAVRPLSVIADLIADVVNNPWWSGPPVRVDAARTDASSSGAHGPVRAGTDHGVTIRIARTQSTVATAAHELGHALAGIGHGHDALYRRAYLDVVEVITNLDPADRRGVLHVRQLLDAFSAAGLTVDSRRWPSPGPSFGGAFAL